MGWDRCPWCYKPFYEGLCECEPIKQIGQSSPKQKGEKTMSKKLTKAQKSARKAVKTRQARDKLYSTYGYETYEVLELMMKGKSNAEVERMTSIPMRSVASYSANLTRGTYNWVLAHCNF